MNKQLSPPYEGIELGIGESLIIKAISDATGKSAASIKQEYSKLGDLGLVAQASGHNVRTLVPPKPLTVQDVYKTLKQIALEKGHASVKKKQDRIRQLLVACRECEAQFIIRLLQGKIRINMGPKTALVALAHAAAYARKSPLTKEELNNAAAALQTAYNSQPNWETIVPLLLEKDVWSLPNYVTLTIGIPVEPMLAQPSKGIAAALERLHGQKFTCEFKYDGERTQIHRMKDGRVKIFSRNLEDTTSKFPDIVAFLPKIFNQNEVTDFILDCEAVAYDREAGKIKSFQVLSTRARKEVKLEDIKVQLCLFAFDLLYFNGQPLVNDDLKARREKLFKYFHPSNGEFQFVRYKDFEDTFEIEAFLHEAIENQCEGLMVKILEGPNSRYEIAKRSFNWLKLKKDYIDNLTDSFDLVPIGAFYGKGKRTGNFGAFLLACYDPESEQFQSACKLGTGFSDEILAQHTQQLMQHQLKEKPPYFVTGETMKPDVWFEPVQVWEVRAADLSLSPVHMAAIGLVSESKGIGLRFPRFIRVREDKNPEQATTGEQIAAMYRAHNQEQANEQSSPEDEEEN
jgi:DNA ligase-1